MEIAADSESCLRVNVKHLFDVRGFIIDAVSVLTHARLQSDCFLGK